MKENTMASSQRQEEIQNYWKMIHAMSESTDDYLYLIDYHTRQIYFTNDINKKYLLPPCGENGFSLEDWAKTVYARDLGPVMEDLNRLLSGEKTVHNMEYRLINRDGTRSWVSCRGKVLTDSSGNPLAILGRVSDTVFGQKTDPLTSLLNVRKYIEDIASSLEKGKKGCLLILGFDDFKNINIKYGRSFGNYILKHTAEVLEKTVDPTFLLYRLDGDRFAINLIHQEKAEAEKIYNEVRKQLASWCTLSAGAVLYAPGTHTDGDTLYQYAENALEQAKKRGKNLLVFFSLNDYEIQRSEVELTAEMKQSIRHQFHGFHLCYQPQVSAGNCCLYGVEALLRYTSPSRGEVSPIDFIPLLERSELICQVGKWVLETALASCRKWRRTFPDLHISVNVSYLQLREDGITEFVLSALKAAGLPGDALTLEITESMQLHDYQYFNRIFYELEKAGIQIAIDDFGTGYSSLSYLKSIEINEIKIDRCFVRGVQNSAYNYRLLSNIIELSKSTQIRVCCEGVETEDELMTLNELGPDVLQGFLFATPYREDQFEDLYLHSDSDGFRKRLEKEQYYRSILEKKEASFLDTIDNQDLISIVESMDELVCVNDAETYELYFLNSAGRRLTGIYDYKGRKCYEVMYGRSAPCEFCALGTLPKNEFRIFETANHYLNANFRIKEKLIPWNQKMARLEITENLLEHARPIRSLEEHFEEKLISGSQILIEEPNTESAIQNVLRLIGEFYLADRTYIFEPDRNTPAWNNTYEWCQAKVIPHQDQLRGMPEKFIQRWIPLFHCGHSVMIEHVNDLITQSPEEWKLLHSLDIRRLIAAPLLKNGQLLGFIGVDNPKMHEVEDDLLHAISLFIADRLSRDANNDRIPELLGNRASDILAAAKLGLWIIRVHKNPRENEMYADAVMLHLLGLSRQIPPEECYQQWHSRIKEGYYRYVNAAVETMLNDQRIVQVEYTWNHPELGEVVVRCLGVRVEDSCGFPCLYGYHRIISNIDRPGFLSEETARAVFEYNEHQKSIYFHTGSELLDVTTDRAEHFPECWIRDGIVHPDFAELFASVFSDVKEKPEIDNMELLLKGAYGTYEWFKLRTRRLSQNKEDLYTIIVLLDSANQERIFELESMRKNDFYQAMLSETIAYAEIDVSTGHPLTTGGLWQAYGEECRQRKEPFSQVVTRHITENVMEDDIERCVSYFDTAQMRELYLSGHHTQRHIFQRMASGEMHWVEMVVHVFQERFTKNTYALLYLKDVDLQKKRELAQSSAANTDPLTKVFNRQMFEHEVLRFLQRSNGTRTGALLLLDIDNFKSINDQYGHQEGDAALLRMTEILQSTFRQRDLVGRFGGDEFLAFIKDVTKREILDRRIAELRQSLGQFKDARLTCSIGITFMRGTEFTYTEYLKQADLALYRSKQLGKDQACYYEDM